ncbi:hypothetical protein ABPG75_013213 [Micractinium tetrahymenae]
MAEPAEAPKRAPLRGPFIMPDGRPLTAALEQQQQFTRRGGGSHKLRPGQIREPKEGWTKPLPRAAAAAPAAPATAAGPLSEAEAAELYALSRVGQRKQRRWLNDKLLRDMAGALTAADMASLFKPVPFGEQRASVWERAAQPEHAFLWDMFRSLEMDKQARVLQKWEAHVRELQAGPSAIRNPAVQAIAAWAGVGWKARQAMKRSSPSHVAAIEAPILAFLQQEPAAAGELVLSDLEDGFHRLIAHGLAEYHGLSSHSRPAPGGGKEVVLRRRAGAALAAAMGPVAASAFGSSPSAAASGSSSLAAAAAAGGEESEDEGGAGEAEGGAPGAPLAIACSDILHILEDEKQPLCPAVLSQAYLHPLDSSSEAGDLHHTAEQLHTHRHAAAAPAAAAAAADSPPHMVLAA